MWPIGPFYRQETRRVPGKTSRYASTRRFRRRDGLDSAERYEKGSRVQRFIMAATLLSALALGLVLVGPSLVFAQSDEGSESGELNTAFIGSAQDDEGDEGGDDLPGSIVGSGGSGSDDEGTDEEQGSDDLPGSLVGSGGTGGDDATTESDPMSDETAATGDVTSMPSTGIGSAVTTSIGLTSVILALCAIAATMAAATSVVHARRS